MEVGVGVGGVEGEETRNRNAVSFSFWMLPLFFCCSPWRIVGWFMEAIHISPRRYGYVCTYICPTKRPRHDDDFDSADGYYYCISRTIIVVSKHVGMAYVVIWYRYKKKK